MPQKKVSRLRLYKMRVLKYCVENNNDANNIWLHSTNNEWTNGIWNMWHKRKNKSIKCQRNNEILDYEFLSLAAVYKTMQF